MVTRDQLDFVLVISKCKYQLRIVAGSGGKKNASRRTLTHRSPILVKKQKKKVFPDFTIIWPRNLKLGMKYSTTKMRKMINSDFFKKASFLGLGTLSTTIAWSLQSDFENIDTGMLIYLKIMRFGQNTIFKKPSFLKKLWDMAEPHFY